MVFDRSVPRTKDARTNDGRSFERPGFAVGVQARSQRPELSLPKGLGLTRPSLPFPTPPQYLKGHHPSIAGKSHRSEPGGTHLCRPAGQRQQRYLGSLRKPDIEAPAPMGLIDPSRLLVTSAFDACGNPRSVREFPETAQGSSQGQGIVKRTAHPGRYCLLIAAVAALSSPRGSALSICGLLTISEAGVTDGGGGPPAVAKLPRRRGTAGRVLSETDSWRPRQFEGLSLASGPTAAHDPRQILELMC